MQARGSGSGSGGGSEGGNAGGAAEVKAAAVDAAEVETSDGGSGSGGGTYPSDDPRCRRVGAGAEAGAEAVLEHLAWAAAAAAGVPAMAVDAAPRWRS